MSYDQTDLYTRKNNAQNCKSLCKMMLIAYFLSSRCQKSAKIGY